MKLVRQVECGLPARLGRPPRSRGVLLGMGLGVVTTLFALLGIAVSGQVVGSASESKADLARAIAKHFAIEAYTAWRETNPGRACPDSIAELTQFTSRTALDPWGHTYELYCSTDAARVTVRSIGADGERGSPDDVWSHL